MGGRLGIMDILAGVLIYGSLALIVNAFIKIFDDLDDLKQKIPKRGKDGRFTRR